MRIDNFLVNNISKDYTHNFFKEGSVFKGEILEILEDSILVDIKGQGLIRSTSDINVKALLGKEISFLVKSNEGNQIEIKPLVDWGSSPIDSDLKENTHILKFLNIFNIENTKSSYSLIENLMEYDVAISEKNVMEAIKTFEKLMELVSLEDNKKVILFEDKNQINNIEKGKTPGPVPSDFEIGNNLSSRATLPERSNIQKLLVVDSGSYPEKEDISYLIKDFLGTSLDNLDDNEINKIISFFIKNEIKPTLNNFKNIKDLVDNPIEFSKDFIRLNQLIHKLEEEGDLSDIKSSLINNEFDNDTKSLFIDKKLNNNIKNFFMDKQFNNIDIKKYSKELKLLQEILEKSEIKSVSNFNLNKEITNIENKVDFLKEMDQNLSFILLPFNYEQKNLDGVFTLLKKNKNKKTSNDKINIFISLDTENLGNVKISCQAKLDSLSIKINMQKSDLGLFQSSKDRLIDRIESMGYTVGSMDFVAEKDLNIIDNMASSNKPSYFLDIKV